MAFFHSWSSRNPYSVNFQGCWPQWQRFESCSTHHFWDSPQHFLKTHFCWEVGFLLFLELQKSLPVSFQRCWTQWQSALKFTISEKPHSIFSKHIFAEKVAFFHSWRLHKSLLVSFQGCWIQWQRFESSSTHHFCRFPYSIFSKHIFSEKVVSCHCS